MSLNTSNASLFVDINIYISVQVAVTCAALYDHALSLGREVELIWMKPLSLVTALYVIERYLGDVVLIAGLCLCFSQSMSQQMYVSWLCNLFGLTVGPVGIQLFQFRAWGALVYGWATQGTMQLRVYALYRRSKRILALLLIVYVCQIAAIAFIIWREIGPNSALKANYNSVSGEHYCTFSGVTGVFIYIFIPFLCFELLIFILAARMFVETVRCNKMRIGEKGPSFMCVLARDSVCYFFVNLVACAVVMGLWQGVTEIYANICVPFTMLLEVLVGTRLILDFRERYAQTGWDPTLSGRSSPLLFRGDGVRTDTPSVSVQCQVETIVVTDDVGDVRTVTQMY